MDVPADLANLRQWMLWSLEHGTKVPYQVTGVRAKSNDPATWTTLAECQASRVPHTGLAFVFSESDPFCGVDLDDCLQDGIYEPWAQEILDRFAGVAYAEISPSGHGVKLTTRAIKPPGSRCSNSKGVECYDHKRFWTWTGNCLGPAYRTIGDGQAAVDWLLATHLAGGTEKPAASVRPQPTTTPPPLSLLARAKSYADNVPGAMHGTLRNSAFQLAGHLHSIEGEHGEHLTDGDVYDLLCGWNLRNELPLREDELRQATINGRKNGTPPAAKLPTVRQAIATGVDLSEFKVPGDAPAVIAPPETPFPTECLRPPGILSDVIDYTLSKSLYPQPELALAGALALLATITGRKIQSDGGARTNIYVLGLAPSGAGKEQSRKTNKELLSLAGGDKLIGPERIASSAGLTTFVRTQLSPLFQLDEIGRLLATMKNSAGKSPHLFNIATILMQLYSSADTVWIGDAYADEKKTPRINQPHCVVYGTAVPDGFWDGLTRESVSDGLLGRMLVFEAPGYVRRRNPKIIDEPPADLLAAIRWWSAFAPGGNMRNENPQPITASHTPEALARFENHLDGIDQRKQADDTDGAALWSRSGEKVAKLALLFAVSRQRETDQITINLDDVNLAIRLANWLTRRMLLKAGLHVSRNAVEADRKSLLRIVIDGGGRIRLNALTRKSQWMKKRERNDYLDELVESGVLCFEREETDGRPITWVVMSKEVS